MRSARTNYKEAKRAMKKDKEKSEEENLINQLGIQVNQLKSKVAGINNTLNFLDEEFTECVISAENKSPAVSVIAKTTALNRKSNDKEEEVRGLEEQLKFY